MNLYECILYDESGCRIIEKLNFDSEEEIKSYALDNNFKIVNIKLIKSKNIKTIKDKDISLLCNQLGLLVSSGCELTHSIDTIQLSCNKKIKTILKNVKYNLQRGNSITASFKNSAKFSNFFINMIKAGELSGKLDDILINMSDYYKKEYEFKRKILISMLYPLILIITCIVVVLFTLTYTVPKFQQSFINMENNLPLGTKILISFSVNLRNNYKIIFIVLLFLIFTLYYLLKREEKLKLYIDKILFKNTITKNIIQSIEISKFTRCLYILICSGIDITMSLDISCNVINSKYMIQQLQTSKILIQRGNSISSSLEYAKVFPSLVISMIKIGEETGKLETCLYNLSLNYEKNLESISRKIIKIIEPMIVLILGLVIGCILVFIMQPIFNSITLIK